MIAPHGMIIAIKRRESDSLFLSLTTISCVASLFSLSCSLVCARVHVYGGGGGDFLPFSSLIFLLPLSLAPFHIRGRRGRLFSSRFLTSFSSLSLSFASSSSTSSRMSAWHAQEGEVSSPSPIFLLSPSLVCSHKEGEEISPTSFLHLSFPLFSLLSSSLSLCPFYVSLLIFIHLIIEPCSHAGEIQTKKKGNPLICDALCLLPIALLHAHVCIHEEEDGRKLFYPPLSPTLPRFLSIFLMPPFPATERERREERVEYREEREFKDLIFSLIIFSFQNAPN